MRFRIALAAVAASAMVAAAGTYEAPLDARATVEVKFTEAPAAVKGADGWTITFAVSAATDVEVAVLNAAGKVVRHLAAGLLGANAPAPLQKDSLAQTLAWDGRDDAGGAAAGGPFTVRVRLGVTPAFEKYLGWDGNTLDPVNGLAVGEKGELYVLLRSWVSRGRTELRVLDREGKYLRTIMPYPATTPAERTKSVGHLVIDGQRIPVVFTGHGHNLHPMVAGLKKQTMAWNPRGHLVVVSTPGTAFEHGLPRHLLTFDPRGGAPEGMSFVGPELRVPSGLMYGHGEGDDPFFDHVACSPDGKYIYYTPSTYYSHHAVYRLSWGEDKGSGVEAAFLGEDFHPGGDDGHLNDPQGLAVDAKGRIYVCDRGNNRVMVFDPDGKVVGKFPADAPEQIAVSPATGEIYLMCRAKPHGGVPKDTGPLSMAEYKAWRERQRKRMEQWGKLMPPKLLKLSAFGDGPPRVLARLDEPVDLFALDAGAKPVKLWATIANRLVPILDRGDRFEVGEAVGNGDGLVYPGYITPDPAHNRVLVQALSSSYKVRALDLATGEKSNFLTGVSEIALAPDGTIYGAGTYESNALLRFDADGKPANWPGTDSNRLAIRPWRAFGVGLGQRGMTVAANGDLYFIRNNGENGTFSRIDVFSPDGKLKRAALVDGMGVGDCGIGVDAAGNVYIGANVKPADRLVPDDFAGKVPTIDWLCWAQWKWQYRPAPWQYMMRNEYLYHWGSVFKFGPEGGAFYGRGSRIRESRGSAKTASLANAPAGGPEYLSGYLYYNVTVDGAKWRYPGMGIVPASERFWGDPSCVCMTSRLAADPYGRVYLPNVFRFCVEQIDTAGNRLCRVGRYGNADDQGPAPYFAWPAFVGVDENRLYVSDSVNRRVTVLKLEAAAEAACAAR